MFHLASATSGVNRHRKWAAFMSCQVVKDHARNERAQMDPGTGFEPAFSGSEPEVLPLDDPGSDFLFSGGSSRNRDPQPSSFGVLRFRYAEFHELPSLRWTHLSCCPFGHGGRSRASHAC